MTKYQITEINGKIKSLIRGIELEKRPEEMVRQNFVCKLLNDFGYTLDQMDEEKNLTEYSDRGTGQASADIIVWKNKEAKDNGDNAFMIVEVKAENITLTEKDYYQGANYARWSGAEILIVTNGKEEKIFKILKEKLPFSKRQISNIPHASIINDEKKLEEELIKTTTMTREEFVNLLFKCHNIIRNNDKLSPEAAFDEISKILFMKIRYERTNKGKRFSHEYYVKAREFHNENGNTNPLYQQLFELTKQEFAKDHLFEANETLKIRENSFESIVKELQTKDLSNTSDDVKGIAFEKFLGRTFRGELGQFFTPRTVVDYMVDILDPKEGELVCDPACGSGGFLIKAFEHIRTQIENEIAGEIEKIQKKYYGEYPETSQEQIDKNLANPEINKKVESLISELKKELELTTDREKIVSRIDVLSKTCIFGTDANPRMARVSKMNMIMHGDGHGGVHHNDGLLNVNGIFENRFDVILANPPFGSRVPKELKIEESDKYKDEEKKQYYIKKYGDEYLEALQQVELNIGKSLLSLYDLGSISGLTEVLFIERCLRLLKKGGRMGIVLPDGVLNGSNLQKARDYFMGKAKILLITSIPQDVFISSGATVKSSLVFLKRLTEEEEISYETAKNEVAKDLGLTFKEESKEFYWLNFEDNIDWKKVEEYISLLEKQEIEINELEFEYKNKISIEKDNKNNDLAKELEKELKEKIKNLKSNHKSEINLLKETKKSEFFEKLKEKIAYEVPIVEVEKAGISTTGTEIENDLDNVKPEFETYRKQNNLWIDNKTNYSYRVEKDSIIKVKN